MFNCKGRCYLLIAVPPCLLNGEQRVFKVSGIDTGLLLWEVFSHSFDRITVIRTGLVFSHSEVVFDWFGVKILSARGISLWNGSQFTLLVNVFASLSVPHYSGG